MNEEEYIYNNEPLQKSYNNTYTPPEKIEIVYQLMILVHVFVKCRSVFIVMFVHQDTARTHGGNTRKQQ